MRAGRQAPEHAREGLGVSTAGCAARRRSRRCCSPSMFAAFIVQIVFRYLLNLPIGWTSEVTRHHLALAGAVGRGLRRHASARRSASTSSTAPSAARTRRVMAIVTAVALVVLYAHVAAGGRRLRHLHEGGAHGLSRDPLRLALLDLRGLRSSPCIVRYLWILWSRRCAGVAPRGVRSRPRRARASMSLPSPFSHVRSSRSRSLGLLGLPIGHAMIAGSILYLLARRPGHGHGRRAAAERHVHQLHPARGAAVHPRRRAHEHRQHDRAPAAPSATRWSAASAAASRRSTSCRASSSPACPARPSPTPPAPAR